MRIVQQLYVREYLKLIGIVSFGLAAVFSLLDLVDKIDNFAPGKLSLSNIAYYAVLVSPKYLLYVLPMSLLIGCLFVFGMASRAKELIAVKSSGGRLKTLFRPFLVLGVFFTVASFVLGEYIVPTFSERLLAFKRDAMQKTENVAVVEQAVWLRGTDGSFIRIGFYFPEERTAKDVSIFIPGETLLKKRIEAREALWNGDGTGVWQLRDVSLYDIEHGTYRTIPQMAYAHLESPAVFAGGIKKPEDMGIVELLQYRRRLDEAGIKNAKILVDLHMKMSHPFMNFFMVLFGLALSGTGRFGGGLFAAGAGIALSLLYWLLYTFLLSMGYARLIQPVIAPWIVPVLFGSFAAYLFAKIPE